MRVNMFRLRFTTDCHPRTKKGHPPQRTTGVPSASSSHPSVRGDARFSKGRRGMKSAIATRNSGTVSTALTQNRRRMSANSALSSSSAATVRGPRAIPHFGQSPGASRTTSGCMGQVHSLLKPGATGSSAIPHFGQLPGPTCRISGCMGQVYSAPRTISPPGGLLLSGGFAPSLASHVPARTLPKLRQATRAAEHVLRTFPGYPMGASLPHFHPANGVPPPYRTLDGFLLPVASTNIARRFYRTSIPRRVSGHARRLPICSRDHGPRYPDSLYPTRGIYMTDRPPTAFSFSSLLTSLP